MHTISRNRLVAATVTVIILTATTLLLGDLRPPRTAVRRRLDEAKKRGKSIAASWMQLKRLGTFLPDEEPVGMPKEEIQVIPKNGLEEEPKDEANVPPKSDSQPSAPLQGLEAPKHVSPSDKVKATGKAIASAWLRNEIISASNAESEEPASIEIPQITPSGEERPEQPKQQRSAGKGPPTAKKQGFAASLGLTTHTESVVTKKDVKKFGHGEDAAPMDESMRSEVLAELEKAESEYGRKRYHMARQSQEVKDEGKRLDEQIKSLKAVLMGHKMATKDTAHAAREPDSSVEPFAPPKKAWSVATPYGAPVAPKEPVDAEVFGGGSGSERVAFLGRLKVAAATKEDYARASMLQDNERAIEYATKLRGAVDEALARNDQDMLNLIRGVIVAARSVVGGAADDGNSKLPELAKQFAADLSSQVDQGHYSNVEIMKNVLDTAFWPIVQLG